VDTTTLAQIHRAINIIISDICLRGQEDDLLRRGAFPVSIRRACPAVPACHATCTTVLAGPKQAPVRKRIREIAKTWMRYRDRRIHVLLRRDGWRANIKRVHRQLRAAKRSVFTSVRLEGHSNSHCCFSSRFWSGSLIDNQLVVAGPFTCVSTNSVATTRAELAPRPHLRLSFRFAQEDSAESCHWGASKPTSSRLTACVRS
jgi:transposase InsO family protein